MNTLLWKLLRQHISPGQFVGFILANLVGMFIVLISFQFYHDVISAFTAPDGIIKNTYLIVSKRISTASAISGSEIGFTASEIKDLNHQSFIKRVGAFTASQYKVYASLDKGNGMNFGTDMFFESVPDMFIDTDLHAWNFTSESQEIPIIIPRSYLSMYNFGFAQSQKLPKLSEGVVSMIQMDIQLHSNGLKENFKGRVVGFSNRINTILVPETFMEWSNKHFAFKTSDSASALPTRLIVEVNNPTDTRIAKYLKQKNYEIASDALDTGKTTFFLKVIASIVIMIGLLISALSFYILMLSVYLLIQKNATKLQTLLLIGYTSQQVSMPYVLMTVILNTLVLLGAFILVVVVRNIYLNQLWQFFPMLEPANMINTLFIGISLFVLITMLNSIAIIRKIQNL